VYVLHSSPALEERVRARPSEATKKLFALATKHDDGPALLRISRKYPALLPAVEWTRRLTKSVMRMPAKAGRGDSMGNFEVLLQAADGSNESVSTEFFNNVLRETASLPLVLRLLREMHRRKVDPDRDTYVLLLRIFGSHEDRGGVETTFAAATERGFADERDLVVAAVKAFGSCRNLERVSELVHHKSLGTLSRDSILRLRMQALLHASKPAEAGRLFQGLELRTARDYRELVHGWLRVGELRKALLVFEHMRGEGLADDATGLRTVLMIYCHSAHSDGAAAVLEEMQGRKIGLSPGMTSMLMHTFANAGEDQRVLEIFAQNTRAGMKPTVTMFWAAIRSQLNLCKTREAFATLEDMMDRGLRPSTKMVDSLCRRLGRGGNVHNVEKLLSIASDLGVRPSLATYEAQMTAYLSADDNVRVLQFFRNLRSAGLCPRTRSYNLLLAALNKLGQEYEFRAILGDMQRDGAEPNSETFARFIQSRHVTAEVAGAALSEMKIRSIPLQTRVVEAVFRKLVFAGKPQSAEEILRDCAVQGLVVDDELRARLIRSSVLAGQSGVAKKLFAESTHLPISSYFDVLRATRTAAEVAEVVDRAERQGVAEQQLYVSLLQKRALEGDCEKATKLWNEAPIVSSRARARALMHLSIVQSPEYIVQAFEADSRLRRKGICGWMALVRVYSRTGNFHEALRVIRRAHRLGSRAGASVPIYNQVLKELGSRGMYSLSKSVLATMRRRKVEPTSTTLAMLITSAGNSKSRVEVQRLQNIALRKGYTEDRRVQKAIAEAVEKCALTDESPLQDAPSDKECELMSVDSPAQAV